MPKFGITPKTNAKGKKNSRLNGGDTTDAPLPGIKYVSVSGLGVGAAQDYSCLKCGTVFTIKKQGFTSRRTVVVIALNIMCPVCHSPIEQ